MTKEVRLLPFDSIIMMFGQTPNSIRSVLILFELFLLVHISVCNSQKWDHFMFAQAWPPGTCADAGKEHHTCHIGSQVKSWTIHGLWPTLGETKGPTSCNTSWTFDFSKIASLASQLKTYWPNLYNDTTQDSFWAYEWIKHGTCGTNLPDISNEYKYFKKSLDLIRKYDMGAILSDSNVVPSKTTMYSFDDFLNAVQKATGFPPVLQCTITEQNGEKYHLIDQIQICLNKDFSPRSCSDNTVYPLGYYHSKGDNSTMASIGKGVKNDLIGRRSHHHYHGPPQSSCSKKYKFYYPPIHQV
ncbi:ribonuclease Oy-like isoform X1 [Ruditapes philippinarum]|uniref:ribonuclease Oy-like isoform X1 n=2 Tax=Ruditapes philippinarum TaxID=129788 RepID=UPI00295C1154|nr:ribonuclease Oy-like isoform X1 [Ruditapes philippinarum]